jgi:hypothetical protein
MLYFQTTLDAPNGRVIAVDLTRPDEIVETVPETDRPMLAGSNVGGEYGDGWHASGIKTRRQNAVDDFVAAGRWLTEAGYTSAARLAANGSSASGALAGIVSLRHGDTFAASTVDYPIADLAHADLRRARGEHCDDRGNAGFRQCIESAYSADGSRGEVLMSLGERVWDTFP